MTEASKHNRQRMLFVTFLFCSTWLVLIVSRQNNLANAATNTWYVALGGNDADSCNSPTQPCATIQAVVDKAAAGDTVLAASNSFSDGVTLSKDLIMSGGWDATFSSQDGMTTIDLAFVWSKIGIGVNEGITAQIEYFKVQNSRSQGSGVQNRGDLILTHCVITNNSGFMGSGIFNSGTMTISECSIDHNYDAYYGGGIYNEGDMTILDSSIDHNNASNAGGVYNGNQYKTSTVVIKNSTIWANDAGIGGGIENSSVVEMINTTIAENSASDLYGGIYNPGKSLTLSNCSVVANQGYGLVADGDANVHLQNTIMIKNTSGDALNMPFLDGYNMIGSIISPIGGSDGPGNIIGVQTGVYPLEGWPPYAPLYPTSPAIDHGDPSGCHDSVGNLLNTDMRGKPRFGLCDIGAYELQPIGFSTFTVDHNQPHTDTLVTYKINLVNNSAAVISDVQVTNELPVRFTYIPNSLLASSGNVALEKGVISWSGSIEAGQPILIQYQVNVGTITGTITNTAIITSSGEVLNRSASVQVVDKYYTYLPCISNPCLPSFSDNFSNPASGWWTESGDDYSMEYLNGEYRITVNPGWIAWSTLDFGLSDYRVEVDARAAGQLGGGVGLMFGLNNDGFYVFEISNGEYGLWRIASGPWTWTTLVDWTASSAIRGGNQTNRLKVARSGDNITLYANGQLLTTIYDGTYRGTELGMASDAYSASFDGRFDNFALYTGSCINAAAPVISQSQAAPVKRSSMGGGPGIHKP